MQSLPDTNPMFDSYRRLLLWIFVFGAAGAGMELILIKHMEDSWQWTPLVLLGVSLPLAVWCMAAPSALPVRVFRVWMILFVVSGFTGLWLHYQGNVEFELEMYPTMKGFQLFWEAVKGATPALAPGAMILLGLLGWLYTHRHPALDVPPHQQTLTESYHET